MASETHRRAPLAWQLARLAFAGSAKQAFLDRWWISLLLRWTPSGYRRGLALRILSLSPHYFIYQWTLYPATWTRREVLEAECERNRRSRRQIADHVLGPALEADWTVLDFGCGPGFLAAELSRRVRKVIGVDVSSGTLACARVLNPAPSYLLTRGGRLPVEDEAVEAIYSLAVFQHINPREWPVHFGEFMRVLRPGGRGFCHFVITDAEPLEYEDPGGVRLRYSLRFEQGTEQGVMRALAEEGFDEIRLVAVKEIADIDDDIGDQHLASFRKPG